MNLKTGVWRKPSTPNFPKNEHFLPPDTLRGKKCSLFGNLACFFFLETPVFEFNLFGLLPTIGFLVLSEGYKMRILVRNGSFLNRNKFMVVFKCLHRLLRLAKKLLTKFLWGSLDEWVTCVRWINLILVSLPCALKIILPAEFFSFYSKNMPYEPTKLVSCF